MRRVNFLDLFNRTFSREHDEIAAEFAGKFHADRARDGHLGRGVDRKIRRKFSDEPANTHILHNRRVHAGGDDGAQIVFRIGQFILKNENVEGDVAFHTAPVKKFHQLRQISLGEIIRTHPGVEFFEAEINRVRAVFDGGLGAFPIAGGREQFGRAPRLCCAVFIIRGFSWNS